MNVLILGGNGRMGPWVVDALAGRHTLRVTDINDPPRSFPHEYRRLSVADLDGVVAAAAGMDAIVNLSVLREDRLQAFEVNLQGNYNLAMAAAEHGIRRIVNTGPHFQLAGPQFEDWDFDLNPDMPPQPGTRLYALTKALGQEVLRVCSEQHDLYVQTLLFMHMLHPGTWLPGRTEPGAKALLGRDLNRAFTIAWPDTGTAVRAALEVELAKLPSRCETYFVFAPIPHRKFSSDKITRILGWQPTYHLTVLDPPARLRRLRGRGNPAPCHHTAKASFGMAVPISIGSDTARRGSARSTPSAGIVSAPQLSGTGASGRSRPSDRKSAHRSGGMWVCRRWTLAVTYSGRVAPGMAAVTSGWARGNCTAAVARSTPCFLHTAAIAWTRCITSGGGAA